MKPTISLDDRYVDNKHKLLRETQLEVQLPILCRSKDDTNYHLFVVKVLLHNLVPDTFMHSKLYDFSFAASKVELLNPYQYLKSTMHLRDFAQLHQLFSYWTLGMKSNKTQEIANLLPGGFRIEKYWTKTDHSIKLPQQNTTIDLSLHHF